MVQFVRVELPDVPSPKVILPQLPLTGLTSLEVNTALFAARVPIMLNDIPALKRTSTPDGTVKVAPEFTIVLDETMYGLLPVVKTKSEETVGGIVPENAENGTATNDRAINKLLILIVG